MAYRYINRGNFGVRGVNRVSLLETVSTGLCVVDYWERPGKRIRQSLETYDLEEAKKKIAEIIQQRERRGHSMRHTRGETVLYVVQRGENGPIKVGITRILKGRLSQLQNGSAEKLKVLGVYTMKDVESAVHAELERVSRLEGEWFPADLLSRIERFFGAPFDIKLKRAQDEKRVRRGLAPLFATLDSIHGNTYYTRQGGSKHESQSHGNVAGGSLGEVPNPSHSGKNFGLGDSRTVDGGVSR